MGGIKLPYYGDAGSLAANLLECKILFNSVISYAYCRARFMTLDLKDHLLASPMPDPDQMIIPAKYVPPDIDAKYNIQQKVKNGFVYLKIMKDMCGLRQVVLQAYYFLIQTNTTHHWFVVL